jgi:transposase
VLIEKGQNPDRGCIIEGMEINDQLLPTLINASDFNPEQMRASFWYEAYRKQNQEKQELKARLDGAEKDKQELEAKVCRLEKELEQLKEKLNKLSQRNSENSSLPPSSDGYKKKSKGFESKVKKKRGPQYGHEGTTRNGFERIDNQIELNLENCPVCETPLERVESAPVRRSQIAELVSQPVEVNEYQRPLYRCPSCGWQGYADLPLGCRSDFSYGALLSSLVGWLGEVAPQNWTVV